MLISGFCGAVMSGSNISLVAKGAHNTRDETVVNIYSEKCVATTCKCNTQQEISEADPVLLFRMSCNFSSSPVFLSPRTEKRQLAPGILTEIQL